LRANHSPASKWRPAHACVDRHNDPSHVARSEVLEQNPRASWLGGPSRRPDGRTASQPVPLFALVLVAQHARPVARPGDRRTASTVRASVRPALSLLRRPAHRRSARGVVAFHRTLESRRDTRAVRLVKDAVAQVDPPPLSIGDGQTHQPSHGRRRPMILVRPMHVRRPAVD
jgi:hypothetical protein